ncbi:MAG: heavy metal transport/detoxification protein [Muribaculum sp.]|nr:heavy metal transport/detoxification protein [Muribaculum sp.]
MKFKTNAKCNGCKTAILNAVQEKFPDAQWSLDLENTDKVLEVHGIPEDADTAAQVVKTIEETGFKGSWLR